MKRDDVALKTIGRARRIYGALNCVSLLHATEMHEFTKQRCHIAEEIVNVNDPSLASPRRLSQTTARPPALTNSGEDPAKAPCGLVVDFGLKTHV